METKNNKVVNKTKKKYKYKSPNYRIKGDGSVFAIVFYILVEFVYILYYLYKILPIYIKVLFWLIILALITWFIISAVKATNNPTTIQNDTTTTNPNNQN
jgi:hypothetical protein